MPVGNRPDACETVTVRMPVAVNDSENASTISLVKRAASASRCATVSVGVVATGGVVVVGGVGFVGVDDPPPHPENMKTLRTMLASR